MYFYLLNKEAKERYSKKSFKGKIQSRVLKLSALNRRYARGGEVVQRVADKSSKKVGAKK